jgi:hypothetical protein
MKKAIYSIGILILILSSGCKTGLLIGENRVPFEKICGSQSGYSCRANGMGPAKLATYKIYNKERPSCAGKSIEPRSNFCNLGRCIDITAFNNPLGIVIELKKDEVYIDTVKVNFDLKKDNIANIVAELDVALKKNEIKLEVAAEIKNEFTRQLKNYLTIEAYIITYTILSSVQDEIRKAKDGINTESRFMDAAAMLKESNTPMIREVKIVREICQFSENKNITNILSGVLHATGGIEEFKATAILNATVSNKTTSTFVSSFDRSSIYSYGYWNDNWMNKAD